MENNSKSQYDPSIISTILLTPTRKFDKNFSVFGE
jgi:hypothetical protein